MKSCFEGIKDRELAGALFEGYRILMEAKICGELKEIYNWLVGTGDWKVKPGGTHATKLLMVVSPELKETLSRMLKEHKITPNDAAPFSIGIIFTSTRLSYLRAIDGILGEIRHCYQLAAMLEHKCYGHTGADNEWLTKGEEFMTKFMNGRPLNADKNASMGDVPAENALREEPATTVVGEDGQTWEEPWRKFQDKKKLLQSSEGIEGNPMMEGIFSDFGRKLAKGIVTAAMVGGFMTGAAHAGNGNYQQQAGYDRGHNTEVNVQQQDTGKGTFTKADLSNLHKSKAYNDRVTQLLSEMIKKTPKRNEQMMYDDACMQAMNEIVSGKLKP